MNQETFEALALKMGERMHSDDREQSDWVLPAYEIADYVSLAVNEDIAQPLVESANQVRSFLHQSLDPELDYQEHLASVERETCQANDYDLLMSGEKGEFIVWLRQSTDQGFAWFWEHDCCIYPHNIKASPFFPTFESARRAAEQCTHWDGEQAFVTPSNGKTLDDYYDLIGRTGPFPPFDLPVLFRT